MEGRLLIIEDIGDVALHDMATGRRSGCFPYGQRPEGEIQTAAWAGGEEETVIAASGPAEVGGFGSLWTSEVTDPIGTEINPAINAFYLYADPNYGEYLTHLSAGPLGLELTATGLNNPLEVIVERGQPLYWSWSSDAKLAIHVGDRVVLADLMYPDRPVDVLTDEAGMFVTPCWSPDRSVIYAVEGAIVSRAPDGAIERLLEVSGPTRFLLDPDGRRLALVEPRGDVGALVVHDFLTGERVDVLDEPTAGFFWSPEGRRLAALVGAGSDGVRWVVWDGSEVVRFDPFVPSIVWLHEVMPFFEQYAHSHRVWSDDGEALVAPAIVDGGAKAVVQSMGGAVDHLDNARFAWWAGLL